jgi:hypothetical protein
MGQARLGGGAKWPGGLGNRSSQEKKQKKKKRSRLQKGNKLNWLGPPEENRKVFFEFWFRDLDSIQIVLNISKQTLN